MRRVRSTGLRQARRRVRKVLKGDAATVRAMAAWRSKGRVSWRNGGSTVLYARSTCHVNVALDHKQPKTLEGISPSPPALLPLPHASRIKRPHSSEPLDLRRGGARCLHGDGIVDHDTSSLRRLRVRVDVEHTWLGEIPRTSVWYFPHSLKRRNVARVQRDVVDLSVSQSRMTDVSLR